MRCHLLFLIRNTFAILLLPAVLSCSVKEQEERLDALEKRVDSLEEYVSGINMNAIAADLLYRQNLLIEDFKPGAGGYDLTLTDGSVIRVTYGNRIPGVAPVIGIDKEGRWIISTDGGVNFSIIPGSELPSAADGLSPRVGIDADGFWIISLDGGETWEWITSASGNPISANDGKMAGGNYSYFFFRDVSYNSGTNALDFTLVTGDTFSVQIEESFGVQIKDYNGSAWVFSGRDTELPVELTDVASAVWKDVPEGWRFRLDEDNITVSPSPDAVEGDYNAKLMVFSSKGKARTYVYTFHYEPDVVFRDDFNQSGLDTRYWTIYDRRSSSLFNPSVWCYYAWGDEDLTYVKDGVLTMLGVKRDYPNYYTDDPKLPATNYSYYAQGAVTTRYKIYFKPPFRIDINARFTKMAQGIWYALWMVTDKGSSNGEIDIVEKLNYGDRTYHTVHTPYTLHVEQRLQDQKQQENVTIINPMAFNTYSMEIREEAVVILVNDTEVLRYVHIPHSETDPGYQSLRDDLKPWYLKNWTFLDYEWEIIMNIAMGGEWPGPVADDELPGQLDIDWVQVKSL